jgi:hypothetical protein
VHGGEHLFGFQRLGIVVPHSQITQPSLNPLGDRDLTDESP